MRQPDAARVENQKTIKQEAKLLWRLVGPHVDSIVLLLILLAPLQTSLGLNWVDDVVDDHLFHGHRDLCVLLLLLEIRVHVGVSLDRPSAVGCLFIWYRKLRHCVILSDDIVNASYWLLILAVTAFGSQNIAVFRQLPLIYLLACPQLLVWRCH